MLLVGGVLDDGYGRLTVALWRCFFMLDSPEVLYIRLGRIVDLLQRLPKLALIIHSDDLLVLLGEVLSFPHAFRFGDHVPLLLILSDWRFLSRSLLLLGGLFLLCLVGQGVRGHVLQVE